ncbi:MAG: hypothetical protein RLZZ440_2758 [Planctomycetota bacterium]|jgi:hypothetical protein
MNRHRTEQARLDEIARFCQQAIQEQRDRERGPGYGLDDYTEGRIVGGANLARKILRALTGESAGISPAAGRGRRSLAG